MATPVAINLVRKRLDEHDENRARVQSDLKEICAGLDRDVDALEERVCAELEKVFGEEDTRQQELIQARINSNGNGNEDECEVYDSQKYVVWRKNDEKDIKNRVGFRVEKLRDCGTSSRDSIERLKEISEQHYESRMEAKEELSRICGEFKEEVKNLWDEINSELQEAYTAEDKRLQRLLGEKCGEEEVNSKLVLKRAYSLKKDENSTSIKTSYALSAEVMLEDIEKMKIKDIAIKEIRRGRIYLSFNIIGEEEQEILEKSPIMEAISLRAILWEKDEGKSLFGDLGYVLDESRSFSPKVLKRSTLYCIQIRVTISKTSDKLSEEVEIVTPEFFDCGWNDYPIMHDDLLGGYLLVAIEMCHAIVGNMVLPQNRVISLKLSSKGPDMKKHLHFGVAYVTESMKHKPGDFNYGVYFSCHSSRLVSDVSRAYSDFFIWKDNRERVDNNVFEAVIDTRNDTITFIKNGDKLSAVRDKIFPNKLLVPMIYYEGSADELEIVLTEIPERVTDTLTVPSNLKMKNRDAKSVTLIWNNVEENISFYQVEVAEKNMIKHSLENTFRSKELLPDTEYSFRIRAVKEEAVSEWSSSIKVKTLKAPGLSDFFWEECSGCSFKRGEYLVGKDNPRIASAKELVSSTFMGNAPLPLNSVTSWSIKILKSKKNNGDGILIGVAQDTLDRNKPVWRFDCYSSIAFYPPSINLKFVECGPRNERGKSVRTGDVIDVIMDTAKGNLSFGLNGVNFGVVLEGIPLDKPLVPYVCLRNEGDSIELCLPEVKESVGNHIPPPSNITAKTIAWDSITLTWDSVEGASSYQIKMANDESCEESLSNSFVKCDLIQDTEYSFRVCAIRENEVGKWSDVVKFRTKELLVFSPYVWAKCPKHLPDHERYSVSKSTPRVATRVVSDDSPLCILSNIPLSLGKVISWNITVLKAKYDHFRGICIGVVPYDATKSTRNGYCDGWFLSCDYLTLFSGGPHKYWGKKYGSARMGQRMGHLGDTFGVTMDTKRGELSFSMNCVNLGIAYKKIPLNKPLVPCVFLPFEGDSVEIDFFDMYKNEDCASIPSPKNVVVKDPTWNSVTLSWDPTEGPSYYQVETIECGYRDSSAANQFVKSGLLPSKDYSFRVRAVYGNKVSLWSNVAKAKTLEVPSLSEYMWQKCPGYINESRRFTVDEGNPRIATKTVGDGTCSIIKCNVPLPLDEVTSWSIKILKSECNDGRGIYVGVAPYDLYKCINSYAVGVPYKEYGWYLNCNSLHLFSGPPYKYDDKKLYWWPKFSKGEEFARPGDAVGVVMDAKNGNIRFLLRGIDLGIGYKRVPLDKPLVPCVMIEKVNNSVEIVFDSKAEEGNH